MEEYFNAIKNINYRLPRGEICSGDCSEESLWKYCTVRQPHCPSSFESMYDLRLRT